MGFDGLVHRHLLCPLDALAQPPFGIHTRWSLHQRRKWQQAGIPGVEDTFVGRDAPSSLKEG